MFCCGLEGSESQHEEALGARDAEAEAALEADSARDASEARWSTKVDVKAGITGKVEKGTEAAGHQCCGGSYCRKSCSCHLR